MSLNATEIKRMSERLDDALRGALVREVISPRLPRRVTLVLRTPGANHFLQIVMEGGVTRLGRIGTKPRAAEVPQAFVMLLRKELTGTVLDTVTQLNDDRAVRLRFTRRNAEKHLVAELTSRHANLFLTDSDGGIIGSLLNNRSRLRNLVAGEPYAPPFSHPPEEIPISRFPEDDFEACVEAHYAAIEAAATEDADRRLTRRLHKKARQRLEKLVKGLARDLENARKAERLGELAHVLKAHLRAVKKGMERFETLDFMGTPVAIPLDPRKTPVENMTHMYERAGRFGKAREGIEARLERAGRDLDELSRLAEEIDTADDDRLRELRETLVGRHPFLRSAVESKRGKTPQRSPFREYVISGGVARVGRSARDNDTLTLRHAKPNDLWLHVRGGTGSHVVVPLNRGDDPPAELLVDAAHLAAHFSTFKKDQDVEIIYTRRRYVQKPRGAAPGSVRVLREKTLNLRVEAQRLERILGSQTG